MTTSEFVLGMQKTIDLCYLKLVPDRWQRKLFSRRFLSPGITAYCYLMDTTPLSRWIRFLSIIKALQ